MMKAALFLSATAALLALSACSKADQATSGESISNDQVAAKLDAVKLEPGEWESTQEILDVQIRGLPEGVPADAMTRMIGQRTTTRHCITPEQAAKPSAEFLAAQKDTKCTYSSMEMEDGKVKADMSCALPQQAQGQMKMALTGTYLTDRYDIDMNVDADGLPNGMTMVMRMKSTGKHIGDCPATGATAGNAAN